MVIGIKLRYRSQLKDSGIAAFYQYEQKTNDDEVSREFKTAALGSMLSMSQAAFGFNVGQ